LLTAFVIARVPCTAFSLSFPFVLVLWLNVC
jgi:hypothetical protein